jgi:hypothetical protein
MTLEHFKSLVSYDSESGVFRHMRSKPGIFSVGDIAGSVDQEGYRLLCLSGKKYRAHRVAWLFEYGEWPVGQLDHRNRVKSDNRIRNLREATHYQNHANRVLPNLLGLAGVNCDRRLKGKPFTARITYFDHRMGKTVRRHLGNFSTPEDAHEFYDLAAQMAHGEFYCG